jgi:hypothetical protein
MPLNKPAVWVGKVASQLVRKCPDFLQEQYIRRNSVDMLKEPLTASRSEPVDIPC